MQFSSKTLGQVIEKYKKGDLEKGMTTVIRCRIYDPITVSGNKYTTDLFWLLRPYQLDFIDNNFKESKAGLSWEGTISDTAISIKLKCPPQKRL